MRTVTFSNAQVAKRVNGSFVSTWHNRDPKFHNCSYTTEERIVQDNPAAFGTGNFCTFFVTPEREVLHYVVGYATPDLFLRELDFALELAEKALDKERRFRTDGNSAFRDLHLAHRGEHDVQADRIARGKLSTGLQGSGAGGNPRRAEVEAFYSRVHASLALREDPPRLAELWNDYPAMTKFSEGKKTSDCEVPDIVKGK